MILCECTDRPLAEKFTDRNEVRVLIVQWTIV